MTNGAQAPVGVMLMTYGSPSSLDDVPRYISAVRGGREVSDELVREFRRRYAMIGGSPLIEITRAQASALEERLGGAAMVRAGMRFSPPTIGDALREIGSAGARSGVAIIMSPQYSPLLMSGYERAIGGARQEIGQAAPSMRVAGSWHLEPAFIDALAGRITEALDRVPATYRKGVPVLLTAHSLPRRVAEQEPDYLDQLRQTAAAVAEHADLGEHRWTFCWQSAGHEPGEWMKPDFADLMPALAADGHRAVVVAPIQFLADHLEILYDIDIAAREQAEAAGLRFERIRSLNDDRGLVDALAAVVRREIGLAGRASEEELELDDAVIIDR